MARKFLISRLALAAALSAGLAMGVAPASAMAKDKGAQVKVSPGFAKVAAPLQQAINDAIKSLPKDATPQDYAAAKAKVDAAVGDPKAKFASAESAATSPDDKFVLADMMRLYGALSSDKGMMLQAYSSMLASGKLPAESVAKTNYDAAITAYQLKDYASTVKYMTAAKQAGYQDPNNYMDPVLADAMKRTGNASGALDLAKQQIASAKAAGTKPDETSLREALQAAYDAKSTPDVIEYSTMLGTYYPSPDLWNTMINMTTRLEQPDGRQLIDLLRLMDRTNGYKTDFDYKLLADTLLEVGYAKEANDVLNKGIAAGKLNSASADISQRLARAKERMANDTSSNLLGGYERDAGASSASARTLVAAGDVFLSYGQPAKAEQFLARASTMAGVDKDVVMLHLGIALVDEGKFAEAQSTFAKVGGARANDAKLWAAYAASKAKPPA